MPAIPLSDVRKMSDADLISNLSHLLWKEEATNFFTEEEDFVLSAEDMRTLRNIADELEDRFTGQTSKRRA